MRLFFAIPLPPDILRVVSSARVALEQFGAGGRLVSRENTRFLLPTVYRPPRLLSRATADIFKKPA